MPKRSLGDSGFETICESALIFPCTKESESERQKQVQTSVVARISCRVAVDEARGDISRGTSNNFAL